MWFVFVCLRDVENCVCEAIFIYLFDAKWIRKNITIRT